MKSIPRRTFRSWSLLAGFALIALALPATAAGVVVRSDALAKAERLDVSPILDEPPTALDPLPVFLRSGDQAIPDVDPESSRLLGQDQQGIRYWLAKGSDNTTCLIALLPGDRQFAGATCSDTERLSEHGIFLQMNDDKVAGRGVYVPDGTDLSSLGMDLLTPQFAAGGAEAAQPSIELPVAGRASNKGVVLPEMDAQPVGTTLP